MSNRKKNAVLGFVASMGGSSVLQLVGLIVIPLYLSLTSQEQYGLWLTLGAILGWIKIGDMGVGLALTRRSIEALETGNYELLRSLYFGALFITLGFGFIVATVAYAFTAEVAALIKVSDVFRDDFILTYHVLLLIAIIRPAFGATTSLIDAKQHIAFIHFKNTIIQISAILLTVFMLWLGYGLPSFAYGLLFEAVATPFVDIIYLRKIDPRISFKPISPLSKSVTSLLRFGVPFQLLKLTNLVSTSTDNIIIAAMLGASSVAIYTFSGKLAFLFAVFLIGVAPAVLFPGTVQLFETGQNEKIARLYMKLSQLALRSGFLFGLIFYTINEPFINVWVGANNYGGDDLTIAFVVWIVFESFIRGVTNCIYASGKLKGLTVISFIEAILNLVLTIILLESIGLLGAVLATILSRMISFFYVPLKLNYMLRINNIEYLRQVFISAVIGFLPTVLCVGLIDLWLSSYFIDDVVRIIFFSASALAINLVTHEGVFLIRQNGFSWKERFRKLRVNYYSI